MFSDVESDAIVVLALGNRFRGDDGAGPAVLDQLLPFLKQNHQVCAFEGLDDAMAMLNAWDGTRLTIVVDAAVSGAPPGTVHRLCADAVDEAPLPRDVAGCSSHGLGLAEAIELGTAINRLPQELRIWAIEAAAFGPGASLSEPVADAVQSVSREIMTFLNQSGAVQESGHA